MQWIHGVQRVEYTLKEVILSASIFHESSGTLEDGSPQARRLGSGEFSPRQFLTLITNRREVWMIFWSAEQHLPILQLGRGVKLAGHATPRCTQERDNAA